MPSSSARSSPASPRRDGRPLAALPPTGLALTTTMRRSTLLLRRTLKNRRSHVNLQSSNLSRLAPHHRPHLPAALRRFCRAHGALRLRGHLRSRIPARGRGRPAHRRDGCAARAGLHRASAIRAATSSAATTGWMASGRKSSARAAASWPGSPSRPTSSARTSS